MLSNKTLAIWFFFFKEDFLKNFCFTHIRKINNPRGRANFDPKGSYLNKFDRHPLEHVSCQIS
jgi:hypothetical protein